MIYRRFVDNTFLLFRSKKHIEKFRLYLNCQHHNHKTNKIIQHNGNNQQNNPPAVVQSMESLTFLLKSKTCFLITRMALTNALWVFTTEPYSNRCKKNQQISYFLSEFLLVLEWSFNYLDFSSFMILVKEFQ